MARTPLEGTTFLIVFTIEHMYNCNTDAIEVKSQRDWKKG